MNSSNTIRTMMYPSANVMAVDHQELNRLARTQAQGPTSAADGRSRAGVASVPAVAVVWLIGSALHQRDMRVVPVHEQADRQADRQVDGHDDGDALDRLAGLVQRRVGNGHDVLVADRYRQR